MVGLGGRVEWSAPGAHCVTCLPGSKSVDSGDLVHNLAWGVVEGS